MHDFLEVLDARIQCMVNAHALLSRSHWEGVNLAELVRNELAACAGNAHLEDPRSCAEWPCFCGGLRL